MADISKVILPDGNTYNLKDLNIRDEVFGLTTAIASGTNLDTVLAEGRYYCVAVNTPTLSNCPISTSVAFMLVVMVNSYSGRYTQIIIPQGATAINRFYMRGNAASGFGSWMSFSTEPEYDTTPTQGSSNPVTSDGIYAAVTPKLESADVFGLGTTITATVANPVDLDDFMSPGRFCCGATAASNIANLPDGLKSGFELVVEVLSVSSRRVQTLYYNANSMVGTFYKRWYTQNGWSVWYKYEGTPVGESVTAQEVTS